MKYNPAWSLVERAWALVLRRARHHGLKWFAARQMFLAAARK